MFKEYRKLRKYTQEQLADLTNLDTRTIQRIENNQTIPSLDTLKKMIKVLKIEDKDIIEYLKKESD